MRRLRITVRWVPVLGPSVLSTPPPKLDAACSPISVTIGSNVVVGANSVVTHDLPDNCVAVGAPARVVRQLKAD